MQPASNILASARLTAPVLRRFAVHADGVAAYCVSRVIDTDFVAGEHLPFAEYEGVVQASIALFEVENEEHRRMVIRKSVSRDLWVTDAWKYVDRRGEGDFHVSPKYGYFVNAETAYDEIYASRAHFLVRGQLDRVQTLFEELIGVGAKVTSGYGRIAGWDYRIIDNGDEFFGLRDAGGAPLRPIPLWLARRLNCHSSRLAESTVRSPYWRGRRELCLLPEHDIIYDGEIERRIG